MPTSPAEKAIDGDLATAKLRFCAERDPLFLFICNDKPELGSLRADEIRDECLPAATNQLEAFGDKIRSMSREKRSRLRSATGEAGCSNEDRKNGPQPNKVAIRQDVVDALPAGLG